MRRLIVVFTALLVIAIAGTTMLAQRPAATFPVIVVFNDDVPFASYRGMFRADERAQADPDAWDYLDRGVAGLTQALEARGGFKADHVFSSAIRGFSASLTSRQIAALEQDPLVAYVWFDLSVSRGVQAAAGSRKTIARQLSPHQVEQAQKAADAWRKARREGGAQPAAS